MTQQVQNNALSKATEEAFEHGFEGYGSALSILVNDAIKIERSRLTQAEKGNESTAFQ